jgi:hypothetical protein
LVLAGFFILRKQRSRPSRHWHPEADSGGNDLPEVNVAPKVDVRPIRHELEASGDYGKTVNELPGVLGKPGLSVNSSHNTHKLFGEMAASKDKTQKAHSRSVNDVEQPETAPLERSDEAECAMVEQPPTEGHESELRLALAKRNESNGKTFNVTSCGSS